MPALNILHSQNERTKETARPSRSLGHIKPQESLRELANGYDRNTGSCMRFVMAECLRRYAQEMPLSTVFPEVAWYGMCEGR